MWQNAHSDLGCSLAVGAVELPREVTPPGGLGARSIRVFGWERQLQFHEEDRSLRELTCLLVDLV